MRESICDLTMRTSDLQFQLLNTALLAISSAAIALRDKDNRNAYRRLDVEKEDGLVDAIAFYETILSNVLMHWGEGKDNAQIVIDDLDDAWEELFNVVGGRLINHEPLETARNTLAYLHERLEVKLKSPIGTALDDGANSAIRAFMASLSNLQGTLISEISNPPPPLPKSTEQLLAKKKFVRQVRGYVKLTGCKIEEGIESVAHVLLGELCSLSIATSKNNLRQLFYNNTFKDVDACPGEELVREGIISEEDYARLKNSH